jgi:ferredoxin
VGTSGAPMVDVRRPIRQSPVVRADLLGPMIRLFGAAVKAKPRVQPKLCRACRACAGICPAGAISVDRSAVVDSGKCLECFCCLEACPYDAIVVKRSPLYGAAWSIKHWMDARHVR